MTITAAPLSGFPFQFFSSDTVLWNGSANGIGTTYVDPTHLTMTIAANLLSSAGSVQVSVQETCGGNGATWNTQSNPATLTVSAKPSPVSITTTSTLPNGTVASSYNVQFAATGGTSPYNWTIVQFSGSLPQGLSLSTTGALSGTPTAAGNYNFSVQVTDSASPRNTTTSAFSLTIAPQALVITTPPALPDATQGHAYSTNLQATGGSTPYTWSLISGSLPAGISLSARGTVSGTTTVAAIFSFTAQVSDSATPAQVVSASFTLAVTAPQGGTLTLVSAEAANPALGGNGISQDEISAISTTGRYVVFDSAATNLTSPPPQTAQNFLRDTCIGAGTGCTPIARFTDLTSSGQEPTPVNCSNCGLSDYPFAISGDGSVVLFVSNASNLGGPGNGQFPNVVYARYACPQAGLIGCPASTTLISVDNSGSAIAADYPDVLSRDGRFVAFGSQRGFPYVFNSLYLRDTCLGMPSSQCSPGTTLLSVDGQGNPIKTADFFPDGVSVGGRYVLYRLDYNGTSQPVQEYIRDLQSGTSTAVSVDNSGNPFSNGAGEGSMSNDGRYVSFVAAGVANPLLQQVYVRDTCNGTAGSCSPSTILVSANLSGQESNGDAQMVFGQGYMSENGRYVAFSAYATDLTSVGNSYNQPLGYVRDTCSGAGAGTCTPTTRLVTVDSNGVPVPLSTIYPTLHLSGDGHYVTFPWKDPSGIQQLVIAPTSF